MRQPLYPSDISREQFEQIRPLLEQARKQTKPRQLDLYDLWCGLNYQLHTGCTWRDLPKDYPKWQSVYSYYLKWSESRHNNPSVLQQALAKLANRSVESASQSPVNPAKATQSAPAFKMNHHCSIA